MSEDRYIAYTRRFFRTWLPVYDLFALSISHVYRAAARRIDPGPSRAVLDVCAGTGEMSVRCAREGARVVGIDVTEAMLRKARTKVAKLPVELVLMDARRLAFPDACFDTSVLSFALHDMPRKVRLQVLREVARVTRERIVITDYGVRGGPRLRRWLVRAVSLFETAYFPQFAREGLGPLLDELGLRAVEVARPAPLVFSIHEIDLR